MSSDPSNELAIKLQTAGILEERACRENGQDAPVPLPNAPPKKERKRVQFAMEDESMGVNVIEIADIFDEADRRADLESTALWLEKEDDMQSSSTLTSTLS